MAVVAAGAALDSWLVCGGWGCLGSCIGAGGRGGVGGTAPSVATTGPGEVAKGVGGGLVLAAGAMAGV